MSPRVESSPIDDAPVDGVPINEVPVEEVPVYEAPIEVVESSPESPVEASPVDDAPVDESPIDEAPINEVGASPESPVDASPVDEVPVQDSPIEVVDASPESPVDEAQDEEEDEAQDEVDRVADTLDKNFGANDKGEGVIGSSNTMGDCKYDGSLGMSAESKEYQAECMRLNMAECIMGGSHGACTYVAAEGSAIGCMWDGTGCGQGCIPANMVSRCAELSHDLEACDGEQGQELRCKWSKSGAETMGMGMGMAQDEGAEESMAYPQAPEAPEGGEEAMPYPAAPENEEEAAQSVSMGYPADGEYGEYYAGYPADGSIPDAAETMGLPPQHRPKSATDKRRE